MESYLKFINCVIDNGVVCDFFNWIINDQMGELIVNFEGATKDMLTVCVRPLESSFNTDHTK